MCKKRTPRSVALGSEFRILSSLVPHLYRLRSPTDEQYFSECCASERCAFIPHIESMPVKCITICGWIFGNFDHNKTCTPVQNKWWKCLKNETNDFTFIPYTSARNSVFFCWFVSIFRISIIKWSKSSSFTAQESFIRSYRYSYS